jgi:Rieske Fe-S protein
MKLPNLHIFYLISIFLLPLSSSCNKETNESIPDVYVSFTINIFIDPEFMSLQVQNNSIAINNNTIGAQTLGYNNNGIIVYNTGGNEFYAFDCTCPYDFPKSVKVSSIDNDGIVNCPVCHSTYLLQSSGMPTTQGPAVYPLKEYKTSYNPNSGDLYISN